MGRERERVRERAALPDDDGLYIYIYIYIYGGMGQLLSNLHRNENGILYYQN